MSSIRSRLYDQIAHVELNFKRCKFLSEFHILLVFFYLSFICLLPKHPFILRLLSVLLKITRFILVSSKMEYIKNN